MTRLAEMFNVNHFIVSQVNPHVVPFLSRDDRLYPATTPGRLRHQSSPDNGDWMYTLTTLAKDEALHRLQFLTELGVFPNLFTKLRCILSQKYSGDITILPEIALQDLPRILKNPNSDFMLRNCLIGERATWPKLSRVRDRCAIELALDQAVHALRARVVFSKSQVNLRRLVGRSEPQVHVPRRYLNRMNSAELTSNVNRCSYSTRSSHHYHHPPSSGEGTSEEQPQARRRRSSGGSVQLLAARHKHGFQSTDDMLTDEQSEEEERLEMGMRRRSRAASRASIIAKPRLRRLTKSQILQPPRLKTSPSAIGPHHGASSSDEHHHRQPATFDFSKPPTPPVGSNGGNDSAVGFDDSTVEEMSRMSALSPTRVDIKVTDCSTPPRDKEGGKDRDHADDADVDSDSEEHPGR